MTSSERFHSIGKAAIRKLSDPVDGAILVYLRIVVGIAAFFWAQSFLADSKYISIFLAPRFLFKYDGLEWVKLWPGDGIYWHFVVTKVAGICLAFGLLTRVSAAVISLSIAYVLMVERAIYVDHYYLLSSLAMLLVLLPPNRQVALDRLVGYSPPQETVPRWHLWLVRFQLALPYVGGGIAMLSSDWLAGEPAGLITTQRTDFPMVGPLLSTDFAAPLITWGGLGFNLLVIPLLLFRPTRWIAVVAAVAFHLISALSLDVGMFPWVMLATLVVFFPAETIRNRIRIVVGHETIEHQEITKRNPPLDAKSSRNGFLLAALFVGLHILVPLRPWISPGDDNWTDRGHRFAWRMMLRDKQALTHFLIVDNTNRDFLFVPSTTVLTQYQSDSADHHPDLVCQTAREVRRFAEEVGAIDNEIYALALVSYNGRQPTPLVNPNIDLGKSSNEWARSIWAMPQPGPLPEPRWDHPKEAWWQETELPVLFFSNLQGRTPSELQAYLKSLDQRPNRTDDTADAVQSKAPKEEQIPRGRSDKYWKFPF